MVGIHGTALNWFQSFLADRRFSVNLRQIYSSSAPLTCGVPQAHVEEEGLETGVDTGARAVPVEQEGRRQTPPLPRELCMRTPPLCGNRELTPPTRELCVSGHRRLGSCVSGHRRLGSCVSGHRRLGSCVKGPHHLRSCVNEPLRLWSCVNRRRHLGSCVNGPRRLGSCVSRLWSGLCGLPDQSRL